MAKLNFVFLTCQLKLGDKAVVGTDTWTFRTPVPYLSVGAGEEEEFGRLVVWGLFMRFGLLVEGSSRLSRYGCA